MLRQNRSKNRSGQHQHDNRIEQFPKCFPLPYYQIVRLEQEEKDFDATPAWSSITSAWPKTDPVWAPLEENGIIVIFHWRYLVGILTRLTSSLTLWLLIIAKP